MRTIKEGSRALKGFNYLEPAINRLGYYVWPGGEVAGPGTGAHNDPLPPLQTYLNFGYAFCAWVPNVMLRRVNKRVPIAQFQSPLYDGGIAAYWGSSMLPQIGAGYYAGFMEGFDLETALRWAYNDRIPVLAGWRYTGVPLHLQGHVDLIFPSGWILQSVPGWGLSWVRASGSYSANHNTVMVRGFNWIEYDGDEVR